MLTQDSGIQVRDRLLYDPVIKGYDQSFFKTTAGTPTISGGNLRLNADSCTSYSQYLYGKFTFWVNVPTTPSSGEAKHWGLRHSATTRGSMFFDIAGAVFSFKSYNEEDTATSTTVTWNQSGGTWETNMTEFKIFWTEKNIKAYVGKILVATHENGDNNMPLPLTLSNSDADNTDIDFVLANNVGKIIA